ncbi:MAG: hypothetical protein AB8B53_10610 [Flavobacteriales bacterium]
MNKTKALTAAVIILLVVNIGLLVFFFLNKPKRHQHIAPKERVIELLQLDDAQVQAYEELIKSHRTDVSALDEQLFEKKKALFALLKTDASTSGETELVAEISALQSEVELTHLNHFRDVKGLCNADQLTRFNSVVGEIQNLFKHFNKRPKPGEDHPKH